jgi:dienelactone hydrolase
MPPRFFKGWMLPVLLVRLLNVTVASGDELIPVGNTRQTVPAEKSFNNAAFDYQIQFRSQRPGYRIYQIKYPSPMKTTLEHNNMVPAEYYVPDGIIISENGNVRGQSHFRLDENRDSPRNARRPAVICLPILDGNDLLTDLMCSVLAQRGVLAIMFRLPYYGERGLEDGPMALVKDPKLFADAIAQAGQDLRRTIDILASRPEIDPEKIGVTGISLGGVIAATAAGGEPRINRAAFLLAGGDLKTIIHHARETRPLSEMILKLSPSDRTNIEAKIAEVDPLRFASTLREKALQGKVIMVNAAEDEVIPRICTEKLAAAMQMNDRVEWIKGLGHYTSMAELPRVLKSTTEFFAQDLPPDTAPPVVKKQNTPMQAIAAVLQQIAVILDTKPEQDKCHVVDLEVTVMPQHQQSPRPLGESQGEDVQKGSFRLIRGPQGKFIFYCKLPTGLEISVGQNDHPWMTTGAKEVYDGTENPGPVLKDPLELLSAKQLALLRMLTGAIKSIDLVPEVLERLIIAKDLGTEHNMRTIQISPNGKFPASVRLELKAENQSKEYSPQSLSFSLPGAEGNVKFIKWQINTPAQDAMFQPPDNIPHSKVEQSFLYSLFSTSLRFLLMVE